MEEEQLPENLISVKEMQELISNLEKFYAERGNPKMNAFWLADINIKRNRADYDMFISASGQRGRGKSNLILLLALLQSRYAGIWRNKNNGRLVKVLPRTKPLDSNWEQLSVDFDFDKNMSFLDNTKELKDKFNSVSRYSAFVLDESSKVLHKQNWASKSQFMLVQLSDTERYQNKSFYLCIPNFRELNSVFRNDRVMMQLYVYERGKCIISIKDPNRYAMDPWHLDENEKVVQDSLRYTPTIARSAAQILKAEQKTKNYGGHLEFPALKDIAPRIWATYLKYKIKNAQQELKQDDETSVPKMVLKWKTATKNIILKMKEVMPQLTTEEISKITNVGKGTIRQLLNKELEDEGVPLVKI